MADSRIRWVGEGVWGGGRRKSGKRVGSELVVGV